MRKVLILLCIQLLSASTWSQSTLVVYFRSGTTQQYSIDLNGKLYFQSDNLLILEDQSKSPVILPITIIRKITLDNQTVGVGTISSNLSFRLFPNPATDEVSLSGSELTNQRISFYNLTGRLVLQAYVDDSQKLDISRLSSGVYLVQCNGLISKFIKL